jgi:hypothetical protein
MSTDIGTWKVQLGALSQDQRAELALFLLASLGPSEEGVEAAWDELATQRATEIRAGKALGRPVDELLADLRERYP